MKFTKIIEIKRRSPKIKNKGPRHPGINGAREIERRKRQIANGQLKVSI